LPLSPRPPDPETPEHLPEEKKQMSDSFHKQLLDSVLRCRYPVHEAISRSRFGWDTSRLNQVISDYLAAPLAVEGSQIAPSGDAGAAPCAGGSAWQPIETAPKDGMEFLAWFPKLRLNDDGDATDEVVGGHQAIVTCRDGQWDEPSWLDASGAYYLDDWCFADMPTLH
jgi:hypothetical protein